MARFAVLGVALALGLPSFASAQDGKRYAVLVGVNGYEHDKLPALKWAVNDAAELGEVLGKSGYAVTLLTDDAGKADPKLAPTKANIEARLKTVLDGAKKGDLVLVCFAGHGLQFEGDKDAYFCPSDARPFKAKSSTLVSLKGVYDELDASHAGMKVLLVDACRDDPAAGRNSRGVGADTAPRPPSGVAAIFSCKAGQRAFEHDDLKHGVFFHHVITGLRGEAADRKGRVTFAGLAAHVGQEVPGDVSRLVGGGAVQTPNLKAEYTTEPVLLAKAAAAAGGVRAADEQVAADLRALERAAVTELNMVYLREAGPRRLAAWRSAAEGGNPAGQVLLGACFDAGVGLEKDEKEAARWYTKAAGAGDARGMTNLGLMYENGRGVEKDEKKAAEWYQKAADAGSALGMTNLGFMYAGGRGGLEKDDKEAVTWYRKAADTGSTRGMHNLGFMYENGRGVEKDDKKAAEWYQKAAAAGNVPGMGSLGAMYENGRGVEKDDKKAAEWYQKAAAAGNVPGMGSLGRMYERGRGVEKDEREARKWYQKVAEAGDPRGMNDVGRMYANGRGVEKDEKEAVTWFRKAAAAGNVPGMGSLGLMYATGRGVEKDEKEAVTWFRKAADAGDATGMYNLGVMYAGGRGIEKDEKEALRWYKKAAALGHQEAKDALKRLGEK